jgi:hypothetical protein
MHIPEHATQIAIDILDLFETRSAESELYEGVLDQIFSTGTMLVSEAERP